MRDQLGIPDRGLAGGLVNRARLGLVPAVLALLTMAFACSSCPPPDRGLLPDECNLLAMDPFSERTVLPQHGKKSEAIFDEGSVLEFKLEFTRANWEEFEVGYWKNPTYNVSDVSELEKSAIIADWEANNGDYYVPCVFEFDGTRFEDAACRPRGSPEGWYKESKPQMKIRFNRWDDDDRFHGLRSLTLEYYRGRPAPVRDRLAMWFMRESGLPASRANHVHLTVGRHDAAGDLEWQDFGLYINIESVDREFLEDRFQDPDGNLYKGGYLKKTNRKSENDCDIWALNDLINFEKDRPDGSDRSAFFEDLSRLIDVQQVLRFLAAEALVQTRDNLSNGSTNYYFYNHPGQNFVAIPWDLDVVLAEERCEPTTDLFVYKDQQPCSEAGDLKRLMLLNPQWKKDYEDQLVELRDGPFQGLIEETQVVCQQVRAGYLADGAWLHDHGPEDFDDECDDIVQRVKDRIEYVKQALNQ